MPAKQWTYSGEEGPEHWAQLDPAFKTCDAGQEQSPINFDLDLIQPIVQVMSRWCEGTALDPRLGFRPPIVDSS